MHGHAGADLGAMNPHPDTPTRRPSTNPAIAMRSRTEPALRSHCARVPLERRSRGARAILARNLRAARERLGRQLCAARAPLPRGRHAGGTFRCPGTQGEGTTAAIVSMATRRNSLPCSTHAAAVGLRTQRLRSRWRGARRLSYAGVVARAHARPLRQRLGRKRARRRRKRRTPERRIGAGSANAVPSLGNLPNGGTH